MTHLQISLLGHPSVSWDRLPLSISRRAVRTLLYYLASSQKTIGRPTICGLFWPDMSEKQARNNLRSLLGKLRASLPDPALVLAHENLISLDTTRVDVDQVHFEKAYNALQNQPWKIPDDTPLPQNLVTQLEQAYTLWRGNHFLESANLVSTPDLDEWLLLTGGTLLSYRQDISRRLATHYNLVGEFDIALKWLLDLIPYDPYNPELFEKIISNLLNSGRIEEARNHLTYFKNSYEKKFQKPLPETIDLFDKAIQGYSTISHVESPKSRLDDQGINYPLVGRGSEITRLNQTQKRGGVVILDGEPGGGKTRLLHEFLKQAHPQVRSMVTTCQDLDNPLPLAALANLLENAITEEEWRSLPGVWANFLSLLLPQIKNIRPEIASPSHITGNEGSRLIFEAFLVLLKMASKDQPFIMVIDDAQWLDESSINALHFLISKAFFKDQRMLIISFQTQHFNTALTNLINKITRTDDNLRIHLLPLSEEATQLLAEQILPEEADESFLHRLWVETGGNPYFVIETLKSLSSEMPGEFRSDFFDNLIGAPSIQALIDRRLSKLPLDQLGVLQAAAVLGYEFSNLHLSHIVNQSYIQITATIKSLVSFGFIHPKHKGDLALIWYQFSHHTIHKAILAGIEISEKQKLHRDAAQALESVNLRLTNQQASELVNHYKIAGMLPDAVRWLLFLAENSWNVFAVDETINLYQQIAQLMDGSAVVFPEDLVVRAGLSIYDFGFESSNFEILHAAGNKCVDLGKLYQSTRLIGLGLFILAGSAYHRGDFHAALTLTERALTYIDTQQDTTLSRKFLLQKGMYLTLLQNFRRAMNSYRFVFENESQLKDQIQMREIFEAHFHLSMLFYRTGNPLKGLEEIEQSFQKFQYILRPYNQIQTNMAYAYNLMDLGKYMDSWVKSSDGLNLSRYMQNQMMSEFFLHLCSLNEIRLGHLDQALAYANELIQKSQVSDHHEMVMRGNGLLGYIYYLLDDHQTSLAHLDTGTQNPLPSNTYYENLFRKGVALSHLGKINESETLIRHVMDQTYQKDMLGIYNLASLSRAYNLILEGNLDQAEELLLSLYDHALLSGSFDLHIGILQALLILKLKSNDLDKATSLTGEIFQKSETSKLPWSTLRLQIIWRSFSSSHNTPPPMISTRIQELFNDLRTNAQSPQFSKALNNFQKKWVD